MRDAVIVDVDGTLCDVSSIEHLVRDRPRDFDAFYRASADCPANSDVVAAVDDAREAGQAIVIVTGRQRRWKRLTERWLADHDIAFDAIYLRGNRDYRPDVQFKTDILETIRQDGYRPVHAWDDRERIVEPWRSHGIGATHVTT